MKKILLLLVAIMFCMNSTALAFKNEPNGFRGIPWGASIEEFKNKYPAAQEVEALELYKGKELRNDYIVNIENDSISEVSITKPIKYGFFNNKLFHVSIVLTGYSMAQSTRNESHILAALDTLYGPCTSKFFSDILDDYLWEGPISKITLSICRDSRTQEIDLIYLSLISVEVQKEYLALSNTLSQESAKKGW